MEESAPESLEANVKLWHERVSIGRRMLDGWAQQSGVDRVYQEYNGKFELFFNGLKGKIPVPPINDIFAYVDADVSNTYNRDPYISVNPSKGGSVEGAKLQEVRLNHYWRKLRTKQEVEPEIIDKDLAGFAFHKVGYEVETEGAEEDLKLLNESLYSARVDWKDIVWNFGAKKPPYDCVWMAQRIVKPLRFIKKKYPAAKDMEGVQNPEIEKTIYDSSSYKDDISVGIIWEIWDKETRQIFLIAEGLSDKWLAPPKSWPVNQQGEQYMDEFPFLMYWDFYAPGKPRPMSAILPWEAQVHEKMILLAAAVLHSKRWNRQMLVRKGAISGNDLDKLERGDDGAIIDYTGTGELDKNLKLLDWGTVPVDYYLLYDRLSAIQRDVSGQPEFERGGVTKTATRTDGELDKIAAGAKGRSDRRVDRFQTHLENIARHMLMHLDANFDLEETVSITGEESQEVLQALGKHFNPVTGTVTFTKSDILGDYEIEIKAGSTLPLNRDAKAQAAKDVMMTLSQLQENGVSPLLRAAISEYLDGFDIKPLNDAFEQEQQANDQNAQMQQQEVDANEAKARSQAAKNVASADKIGAEADAVRIQHPFVPEQPQGNANEPELAMR